MYLSLTLLSLLSSATACLRFVAYAPWDDTLPYTAKITDNDVVTCWISMSYRDHYTMQRFTPADRVLEQPFESEWDFRGWQFECM